MKAVSRTVHETRYGLLCEGLRGLLLDAVRVGPSAIGGTDSAPCRAVAALYFLLAGHPVDRRGRCRSCRRPGAVFGRRWRRCRVYSEVSLWMYQPAEFVGTQLARELGPAAPLLPADANSEIPADRAIPVADEDDTNILPMIDSDPNDSLTTSQSPAVSPPPFLPGGFPRAGRSDPDHGGVGERPRTSPAPPWPIQRC